MELLTLFTIAVSTPTVIKPINSAEIMAKAVVIDTTSIQK